MKSNGSLDSSFGTFGYVFLNVPGFLFTSLNSVITLPSNNFIVSGYARTNLSNSGLFFAKYKPNGAMDSSFGINGYVFNEIDSNYQGAEKMFYETANKIIFSGFSSHTNDGGNTYFRSELFGKIDTNGNFDNTINNVGYRIFATDNFSSSFADFCLLNSGKIVIGNTVYDTLKGGARITRYNNDFTLDSTFDINGSHYFPQPNFVQPNYYGFTLTAINKQSDDKIVVVGYLMDSITSITNGFIARFNCKYNGPVGIPQIEMPNAQVLLFPNPAQDKIRLLYHFNKNVQFIVYGASGAIVLQKELLANQDACDINTSNLLEGLYTYVIVNNGHLSNTGKLVIKR
jgi:uncharacterized delta-60 repeat protein